MIGDFTDGIECEWEIIFGGEHIENVLLGNAAGTDQIVIECDGPFNFKPCTWISPSVR